MKNLWTPWRYKYITNLKERECIFCKAAKSGNDKENLLLFRGTWNFVLLNRYPYSNGHLMVAPYEHVSSPETSDLNALREFIELMNICLKTLRKAYNPDGMNTGMNLGTAAGAGIEEHYHLHVLPRWHGDTNFMTSIAQTRLVPQALDDTWSILKNIIDTFL
jgi:ATP adenylyltransferase